MPKFNERLRELRLDAGLSQQALADVLGISKSSINMYERGEREPGLEMQESIADFFNVDMDYMFGKTPYRNRAIWMQSESPAPLTDNIIPIPITKKVPLVGTIACGSPILAVENANEYAEMPDFINADFALQGCDINDY